ncbi:MAG TPA: AraC family ligand binding domain-containing protein, partial [Terriglobales bacterium]|nr:AraC family ligand binding domain-containing protein [Terriglobales bacterium]
MLSFTPEESTTALGPGAHFGEVKSVRRMGSLIVAESHYSRNFQTPPHWHETASFTMVFGGSYREDFSRRQFECFAGSVLYRPAGEVHCDRIGASGAHCLMIEMPGQWLANMSSFQSHRAMINAPRQCLNDAGIALRIRRELSLGDEFSSFVIEALAVELACEIQRTPVAEHAPAKWLAQLRERVETE